MSECVMPIALGKFPALNFLDFSWPWIGLSVPPHHLSSTNNSGTAKEQKITKQCFLFPPHHGFST